jgi:DNA-binding NtrC family response regulator
MNSVSIMIVENNNDLRATLRHAFEDRGYLTWTCPTPEIAISIFAAIRPNVVLLDLDLEWADPIHLIDLWKEMSPHTRIIVESSDAEAQRMRDAVQHGAQAFLVKPYSMPPLFDLLEKDTPPTPTQLLHRAAA